VAEQKSRREIHAALVARATKDEAFRRELISNPRGVLEREIGVKMPDAVNVSVLEESPQHIYLVLPPALPSIGSGLSDQDLEAVSGGYDTYPTVCDYTCQGCMSYWC
jgi:hypothetical protein